MADDPAFAMLANRGHALDRTLKAVEGMASAGCDQIESLVVFVSTNFTGRHTEILSRIFESPAGLMLPLALTEYFPPDP